MNIRALTVTLAALMLPTAALGADLVIYDGEEEIAIEALDGSADETTGRDYRPFSDYKFPGSGGLWIAGAESTRGCPSGDVYSSEGLEVVLANAVYAIDMLDSELAEEILAKLTRALPCVRDTVFPEQIARLLFLKGMLADYLDRDVKVVEDAFRDALAVNNMDWDEDYAPETGMKFYAMYKIVDEWRNPQHSKNLPVDFRFEYDEDSLVIDGRHDVTTIFPGTHLIQWKVNDARHGRVFVIPQHGVAEVVFASEKEWSDLVLYGPNESSASDMRMAKTYFASLQESNSITVLSLRTPIPTGYVFYPGSVMIAIRVIDVRITKAPEKVPEKVPDTDRRKVNGGVAVFGTYALLRQNSYGGVAIMGYINPVLGLEFGVGGSVMFSRGKLGDYVLPGIAASVRYVFDNKSIVSPFVGVYVPIEIQEPVIVSVTGCGGIRIRLEGVHPTLMACGGAVSEGTGRVQLMIGGEFR